MSLEEQLKEKIQKTERKMKELALHLEHLDRNYQQLLQEMALSSNQMEEDIQNADNFSPEVWEALENERRQLEEKLDLDLKCIRDPFKLKQAFQEQGAIKQHWLFVR
jgi:uncharacterized membrane-anchored protein YhcB (DUF1043 family)